MASASEFAFQNDIIKQLRANGWLLGNPEKYNRELALYEEQTILDSHYMDDVLQAI